MFEVRKLQMSGLSLGIFTIEPFNAELARDFSLGALRCLSVLNRFPELSS
jgi:hypothetical protein